MLTVDIRNQEILRRIAHIDYPSVAEIGVFNGELSRRLLYAINLHLLMVDPWGTVEASEAYKESGDPMALMTSEEWMRIKATALQNVSWAPDRVRVFQGTSIDAAKTFDEQFDLVFIDGDHSKEATEADIEAWWPKVAEGGWLAGHDYRTDKNFGVIMAVDEFIEDNDLELMLGEGHTWFVRK